MISRLLITLVTWDKLRSLLVSLQERGTDYVNRQEGSHVISTTKKSELGLWDRLLLQRGEQ